MPIIKVNDIHIYYEIHGDGEPLVLIGGLANDITDYTDHTRIIHKLSQHYKTIVFDNRGAGRTDKPDAPYSIAMMADDTIGLLAALDVEHAYVIGISMGGRIALELALTRPQMVKKLVLVSTSAKVIKTFQRHILYNLLPRLPIFKGRYPQPYYAFVRQKDASSVYDCAARLPAIHIPTLILHGKKDKTTPYKLAEEMHRLIPGSKLLPFNGGHLFLFFQQEPFVHAIVEFLNEKEMERTHSI